MIENQTQKSSYIWLVLIIVLSMTALFSAGFDHDVVYYGLFLMAFIMGITTILYKEAIELNGIAFVFSLFILWSFVSLIWSISPIRTVIEGIQLISFLLIYLLTKKLSQEGLGKLIKVLLLVTGGIALLGILEYLFVSGSRIHATFTNPNPFGIYMVMIFLMSLALSLRSKSKGYMIFSIIFLSAVFLSGSRASMGALAVALIIPFFGIDKSELKSSIIRFAIIFVSAFVFSQIALYASVYIRENVFVDKSFLESITRSSSFVTSSLKGRLEFWRVAFDLFKNKPVLGYGNGTFFSAYYIEYGMNEWYSRFTHNHYLQMAAEIGAVGVGLFLLFLWTSFKDVIHNAKQSEKPIFFWGMVAGLVAFLLHIGVDFSWNFPAVTMLFFFFLGVTTREDAKAPLKLNKTVSLIGLVFIILVTGWQLGSTKLYMKALDLEQTDSLEAALELTQKVNDIYPISPFGQSYESELLFNRYLSAKNEEDLKASFVVMEKAIGNGPYDAGTHSKMARLYKQTGDYDNAEKHLLIATKYSAYVLNSFIDLSNLYIENGKNGLAEETLLSALERAPFAIKRAPENERESVVDSVAIIHLTLANLYTQAGDQEKVQDQVNQLIELKEEYPFLDKYFK
ncbi:O-antigen ligase family protein [Gudongella sp. DL1XJH-153]|uniref:O-antigen ligase family protein n=1 Tax=Gudongella sp. DL1XJH-153 TaxID=3409804 RepID=UPI003BB76C23